MEENLKKKRLWLVIAVACVCVAVICAVVLIVQAINRYRAKRIYDDLMASVNTGSVIRTVEVPEVDTELPVEEGNVFYYDIPEKNIDWDALHEQSEDIYAWIYVPGYQVDYPILQDPEDDEYYLNHNIDGSTGFPGCIYTEHTYNKKDFSDNNTVIYGHNLKDETMFSHLHDLEEEDLSEAKFIYIYTEDAVYVYHIYAVYDFPAIHLLANKESQKCPTVDILSVLDRKIFWENRCIQF